MNPVEVESQIERLVAQMESETEKLEKLSRESIDAELNFKRIFYQAMLRADARSEALRRAQAELAALDVATERRIAESAYEVSRERLRTIRAALDAYRSINANLRTQV